VGVLGKYSEAYVNKTNIFPWFFSITCGHAIPMINSKMSLNDTMVSIKWDYNK